MYREAHTCTSRDSDSSTNTYLFASPQIDASISRRHGTARQTASASIIHRHMQGTTCFPTFTTHAGAFYRYCNRDAGVEFRISNFNICSWNLHRCMQNCGRQMASASVRRSGSTPPHVTTGRRGWRGRSTIAWIAPTTPPNLLPIWQRETRPGQRRDRAPVEPNTSANEPSGLPKFYLSCATV